ncbi:MAG: iron uptake porin [Prochloraceae cyanobacterium]
MKKINLRLCQKALKLGLNAIALSQIILARTAIAGDLLPLETRENQSPNQFTSVSKLSDVSPEDWSFQALKSLGERYNCIASKSQRDPTHLKKQKLTRYEFALKLNDCLSEINKLIKTQTQIEREDLAVLKRLQQDFATELITLDNKLDNLEAKITNLETQQFSPLTRLKGEIIFAVAKAGGSEKADGSTEAVDDNLTFSDRVRLNFDTSFTGKDRLRIRLETINIPEFEDATGTKMANLGFDGNDENKPELVDLQYRFAIAKQTRVNFSPVGIGLGDFVPKANSLFSGSGKGSISTFGRENPILRQGGGAGVGLSHNFGKAVNLSLGYIASRPTLLETGIFNRPNGAIAQLTLQPNDPTIFTLTYVRSYNNVNTGTGSAIANDPFPDSNDFIGNSLGAELGFRIAPNFILGGRIGWIRATANDLEGKPQADIFTWATTLAFLDLGGEGNLGGIVIGQPPKAIANDLGENFRDEGTSLHWEAFYRIEATKNIAITPGFIVITNPEHNQNKNLIYVLTIRNTFSF